LFANAACGGANLAIDSLALAAPAALAALALHALAVLGAVRVLVDRGPPPEERA